MWVKFVKRRRAAPVTITFGREAHRAREQLEWLLIVEAAGFESKTKQHWGAEGRWRRWQGERHWHAAQLWMEAWRRCGGVKRHAGGVCLIDGLA